MTVLEAFAAHIEELLEGDVPDPLRQPFTLAVIWADLARIAGEEIPAEVAAILDAPVITRESAARVGRWMRMGFLARRGAGGIHPPAPPMHILAGYLARKAEWEERTMRERKFVPNSFRIVGDSAYILLTNRKGDPAGEVLVDLNDLQTALDAGRWYLLTSGYAKSLINGKMTALHRFICNPAPDLVIDHINRNTLDCRRANLRECTNAENVQNRRGARSDSGSGIRNCQWRPKYRTWRVTIRLNGKRIQVGSFASREDAIAAAAEARRQHMPYATD